MGASPEVWKVSLDPGLACLGVFGVVMGGLKASQNCCSLGGVVII